MLEVFVGFVLGVTVVSLLRTTSWRPGSPSIAALLRKSDASSPQTAILGAAPLLVETASPSVTSELVGPLRALAAPAEDVADPRELIEMAEFRAVLEIMRRPDATLELLAQYALGANWPAACAAFAVLAERPDRQALRNDVVRQLGSCRPYVLVYALRYLLSLDERPPVGAALLGAPGWWVGNPVIPGFYREYFAGAEALGDSATFGGALAEVSDLDPEPVTGLLEKIAHPYAAELLAALRGWMDTRVDRQFLNSVGRLLSEADENALLVEPEGWRRSLDSAEAAIRQARPRSVMVTGEPRTGKTAFVELLASRLRRDGWTIFAASGVELMAGQIYIGQLEGRIRQLLDALKSRRKMVWYVPDIAHLADSGTHKGQSASILDQILPAITSGNLILIGEASQKTASRLFQLRPSLRALFELAPLEPMPANDATALAHEVCRRIQDQTGLEIAPAAVSTASDLAQHYLGATESPGAVLGLLKRAAARSISEGARAITSESVVETLSQLSGLPASILDNGQRMDLAEIRAYFTRRVIGQDEAVRVLVDRVAMLKAGLTDPGKPIGVFLFAGPTGTGKTELAKTLAEFLFGSADRIVRLDMSEFQSVDSTTKILGQRGDVEGDALIDRIRKQPFSVVLLDEFEKAHPNCWDLFLQIFDDGRLSDANGREADFRHTIIILTSNLGAAVQEGGAIGFGQRAHEFTEDQVIRTIGRTFRPEFINRLDKVIVFRPLSRDLMRGILNKELSRVLDRRGLRDRDWAVEWEASAIEFLLDRGFSPTMGARPLKRAIDQHLLAPLAETLVEHRAPEGGQFLFIRSAGDRIEVEFLDPDAPGDSADVPPLESAATLILEEIVLRPLGLPAEAAVLTATWRELSEELASDAWLKPTNELKLKLADPAIWSSDQRSRIFATVELSDRIREAAETAERLMNRYVRSSKAPSSDLAGRVALQLFNLRAGMEDLRSNTSIDAVLRVEAALDAGDDSDQGQAWRRTIYDMYRKWAAKRRIQLREITPPGDPGSPILVATGFGSYRTLAAEAGLHVLEEEGDNVRRVAARVIVAPGPEPDTESSRELGAMLQGLAGQAPSAKIVRRYRRQPAPLVRDVRGGWRSGRLDAVLDGDFDLMGAVKRQARPAA